MNPTPLVSTATLVANQYQMASAAHEVNRALRMLHKGKPTLGKLAARLRAAQDTLRLADGEVDRVVADSRSITRSA